jgi:hypothetical protein
MAVKEMLGTETDEMKGDWRKQHNEQLHDVYCEFHIVGPIGTKWLRREEKLICSLAQKIKGKGYFENVDVDGRIKLK